MPNNTKPYVIFTQSADQSRLRINDSFHVYFKRPRPNWWFRMWHWLLLGWQWDSLVVEGDRPCQS